MKEFTATHDCINLFAIDKAALPSVGLRLDLEEADFTNPDDDPRGPWRAFHKGARTRRAKSDFDTFIPPYRWKLIDGTLPKGLWRLNELTGVIWGIPEESGSFDLTIQVSDAVGNVSSKHFTLVSSLDGTESELPVIPWLFQEIEATGPLRIVSETIPEAVVGEELSILFLADGGSPFMSSPKRPGAGRYWEFSDDTLQKAYATDRVDLGDDGNVIVRIKSYATELDEGPIRNQQTWWPAKSRNGDSFAGFTQDATKHLKKMVEVGLISEAVTFAKPEKLLSRLLSIFAPGGGTALELFCQVGDLVSVGLKTGNPIISFVGNSDRDVQLMNSCVLPRIRAVVDGRDAGLENIDGKIKLAQDAYIPYSGGGRFAVGSVGEWLFEQGKDDEYPRMNREYAEIRQFGLALLTSRGYFPSDDGFTGASEDGRRAIILSPDEYLNSTKAAGLISESLDKHLEVFYFMSEDDFDGSMSTERVIFRRIPFELGIL
jgi:hypothetical protein